MIGPRKSLRYGVSWKCIAASWKLLPCSRGAERRRCHDRHGSPALVPSLPAAERLGRARAAASGRHGNDPADRTRRACRRPFPASGRGDPRHAEPAQPRLPTGDGRAHRKGRRLCRGRFLVVAPDHVQLREPPDAGAGRGDRRAPLRRDGEGRLHRRGGVPLSPQPAGRRALRRRCGAGPACRGRRGCSRHPPDAVAGALPGRRLWRGSAQRRPAAVPAGD